MAWKESITCDICSIEKKEVNHWFLIYIELHQEPKGFMICSWEEGDWKTAHFHVCGVECAQKALGRHLTNAEIKTGMTKAMEEPA